MATKKPIDAVRANEGREAVWALIRRLRRFATAELYLEIDLHRSTIRDYLAGLEAAGYIAREGLSTGSAAGVQSPGGHDSPRRPIPPTGRPGKDARTGQQKPIVYILMKDPGIEAPRVRKDGTEVTAGIGREQMWRSMRILGEFCATDLAAVSDQTRPVALNEAKTYIYYLHKAGYLRCVRAAQNGGRNTPGALARYRLIPTRYTGPKPPMIQSVKRVWDPNLKKVVWPPEGADHDG